MFNILQSALHPHPCQFRTQRLMSICSAVTPALLLTSFNFPARVERNTTICSGACLTPPNGNPGYNQAPHTPGVGEESKLLGYTDDSWFAD